MFLKFNHNVAFINSSFFSDEYFIKRMHNRDISVYLYIHLSIHIFFECLTGLHKADKNDYIGNFMWAKVFISLGYLGIELLG